MFKPLKHPNVKILDGLPAFIGMTGVIVDKEGKLASSSTSRSRSPMSASSPMTCGSRPNLR